MKQSYLIILFFLSTFAFKVASSQNVSINILTQNSGLVNVNGTVFLEVTICNTSSSVSVPSYKLRPQISVPASIVSIPTTGHTLPPNWTITFNSGFVIRLSNGTDQVPPGECRTILIAMQGNTVGGPSTISGNLLFSNGVAPGSASGGATAGDNSADNSSTSTIAVTVTTPLRLIDFTALLVNCEPVLNWVTENEINSGNFEIERRNLNNSTWTSIGVVAANGNNTNKSKYNFIDRNLNVSSEQVLYRLKIIDKDGQYKYSQILRVFINCKTTRVEVYPNPVQKGNRLYVSLTGTSGYTEATLLSLSGQVVLKNKINNGTNYLNTSNIASGIYLLEIKDANGVNKKVKVLIQN